MEGKQYPQSFDQVFCLEELKYNNANSLFSPNVKERSLHLIPAISSKIRLQLSQLCIVCRRSQAYLVVSCYFCVCTSCASLTVGLNPTSKRAFTAAADAFRAASCELNLA
jgi:hypothetical protein